MLRDTYLGNNRFLDLLNEPLEARMMLTSGVRVIAHHGDVTVHGDNTDNKITIAFDSGTLYVTGREGTRINGNANGIASASLTDDLRINLKHGDNHLQMAGVPVPDDLLIRTGHGDDVVELYLVGSGDDVMIITGGGTDYIGASIQVGDDLKVISHGSSTVDVIGYFSDDVRVVTGHGRDDVDLSGQVYGNVWVATRGGDDDVTFESTNIHGNVSIVTHAGNDRFEWVGTGSFAHGNIRASMGGGTDYARITAALSSETLLRFHSVEIG